MADYSNEEIRRFVVGMNGGELSAEHVRRLVEETPQIRVRSVERYGDEPRYLFAAHLAYAMLSAEVGTSEKDVFDAFFERSGRNIWPTCTIHDVARLRRIYPFIPLWGINGCKGAKDMSLSESSASSPAFVALLRKLAMIPMSHPLLTWAHEARGELQPLLGMRLLDVSHALADKIPHYLSLIHNGGMCGRDITVLAKHYAADPLVIDVARRVLGVNIEVLPPPSGQADADELVEDTVKKHLLTALDRTSPLLVHMGGVRIWGWLEAQLRARKESLPVAGVSHTTSDGRELLSLKHQISFPCELMSMSSAKIADERDRFRHSLMFLMARLEDELDEHIRSRRFIIKGFGNIMGRAMAEALRAMKLDFAVMDPNPDAQAAARAAGFEVMTSLEQDKNRSLVILGCATGRAVDMKEIESLSKRAIFLQVQSGRAAFPMAEVEAASQTPSGSTARRVVAHLGYLPIYEYQVTTADKSVPHVFVADGYVANLAFARPNNTETSMVTNLIIEESLKQGAFRLRKLAAGDDGMRGAHVLHAINVELTPDKPRRVVSLYPREQEFAPRPLAETLIADDELRTKLDGEWADEAVLVRDNVEGETSIRPLKDADES